MKNINTSIKNLNNTMHLKYKEKNIYAYIFIILILLFLLIPTSKNGIPYELSTVPIYLGCIGIIVSLLIKGNINKKNIYIWTWILSILLFNSLRLSILGVAINMRLGVILQHITFFLLSILIIPEIKFRKVYLNIFFILNVVMIVWGLGIIFSIKSIINFTVNNFLWGDNGTTLDMISKNKPILSFGVHSIASFFFCQMFFLNYITYKTKGIKNKFINIIFMILFMYLNLFLKSTTSLIVACTMFIFIIKLCNSIHRKIFFIIFLSLIILIVLKYNPEIYIGYLTKFSGHGDGINTRYSSNLFAPHFEYIRNNGFIGFTDIGFIYNTDSGYVLNYMRGGIINIILIITSNINLFFSNMNKKYALYATVMTLIFDSITTMFMYPQIVAFIILSLIYIKNLEALELRAF